MEQADCKKRDVIQQIRVQIRFQHPQITQDQFSKSVQEKKNFVDQCYPKYLTAFFLSIKAMFNVKRAEIDFCRTLLISI